MAKETTQSAEPELELGESDAGIESLANLEKKILLTLSQLKSLRAEKSDLQRRVADRDTQLKDLRGRLARMESERETVKTRVQRLIAEVDSASPDSGLESSEQ